MQKTKQKIKNRPTIQTRELTSERFRHARRSFVWARLNVDMNFGTRPSDLPISTNNDLEIDNNRKRGHDTQNILRYRLKLEK